MTKMPVTMTIGINNLLKDELVLELEEEDELEHSLKVMEESRQIKRMRGCIDVKRMKVEPGYVLQK